MKSFQELSVFFRHLIEEEESKKPPTKQFIIKEIPKEKDLTRGVFGVHRRIPVDRASAMLLAKSRWHPLPTAQPEPKGKPEHEKKKQKSKKIRIKKTEHQIKPSPVKKDKAVQELDGFLTVEKAARLLGIK